MLSKRPKVFLMDSLQNNLPTTVSRIGDGPKAIGELDRPFQWLAEVDIQAKLQQVASILRDKYGYQLFSGKLGLELKEDFNKMCMSAGAHVFIADAAATVAVMNERGQNLLVEIRLPGQPYLRGRIENIVAIAKAMDIQPLLSE